MERGVTPRRGNQVGQNLAQDVVRKRIEQIEHEVGGRKGVFAGVGAERLDAAAALAAIGEALDVLARDGIEFGLHFDPNDAGKGIHGRQQQGASLAGAEVDEGIGLEDRCRRKVLHDGGELLLDGGLVETLAEDLAQAHRKRQPRPGGIDGVVAIVVDVSEAAAAALGQGVLDALDELAGEIAERAGEAAGAEGVALPAQGGGGQRGRPGGLRHACIMAFRRVEFRGRGRMRLAARLLLRGAQLRQPDGGCGKVEAEMTTEAEQIRPAGGPSTTPPSATRNFRLFQAARFLLVAALEMQSVAVGWQIYEITRRPLDLGLVGLAQFLPGLLLFLLGGHAADRFDRRHVLLACYSSFALCSLALLSDHAARAARASRRSMR